MKYKICFLVQGQQHYNKLLSIAKILGKEFEVLFLIDTGHFTLKKEEFQKPFEYKLLSDYKYPEPPPQDLPSKNKSGFITRINHVMTSSKSFANIFLKKSGLFGTFIIQVANIWFKYYVIFCLNTKACLKQISLSTYRAVLSPFNILFLKAKSWLKQYPSLYSMLFNTKTKIKSWFRWCFAWLKRCVTIYLRLFNIKSDLQSWFRLCFAWLEAWFKRCIAIYLRLFNIKSDLQSWFRLCFAGLNAWLKQYPFFYSKALLLYQAMNTLSYRHTQNSIKNFILANKIDILVLAEANVEYLTEGYIQQFKKVHKSTVIIPYTFCSPTEPASYYYNNSNFFYKWYHNRLIDKKWVYEIHKRKLIRMPLINIIAIDTLGLTPPNPWIQESSTADALLTESEMMKQHYLKHSIALKQIQCIGDISHDLIYQAYKNRKQLKTKLCKELFLDPKKDIVVFAVFPNFMHIQASKTQFRSYEQALEFIYTELNNLNAFNVVVCLHPSLKKENFAFLERLNVKISTRPTTELIAVTDLYVASISATIKWAIAMGIPVINYDVYKFRYGDYNAVPGVLNIETKSELSTIIKKLNKNPAYLKKLATAQKRVKNDWGIIDGKFHLRIQRLFKKLIKNGQS